MVLTFQALSLFMALYYTNVNILNCVMVSKDGGNFPMAPIFGAPLGWVLFFVACGGV